MKKTFVQICILFLSMISLNSTNVMDIMTTIEGEYNGAQMGISMASLDFNGDGYKDLVVVESFWNPTGIFDSQNPYGKILFYMGGQGFNNIPEFTINGSFRRHLQGYICNGGDINGDGKEDLVMYTTDRVVPPDSTQEVYSLYVWYGRVVPQTAPDYTLNVHYGSIIEFYVNPLGDINGDGYDDLALITNNPLRDNRTATVILGNSFVQIPFFHNNGVSNSWGLDLSGIGDVNNDGIDDFHLYYPTSNSTTGDIKLIVYFGSTGFPDCDSLVICENTNCIVTETGCPIGDVNGDGVTDFLSYMCSTGKVWFGGNSLSSNWNVAISPGFWNSGGPNLGVVYGDFNGDGFDDIIGSQFSYYGWTGAACLWLGKQQFNGTMDMEFYAIQLGQQYGWAKAAGDFNGDGLCDVAISAPWWTNGSPLSLGFVYVYSGNTSLHDTTISNEDTVIVPHSKLWDISIYPNPIKSDKVQLNISFKGTGYTTLPGAELLICNLKGQKLYSYTLTPEVLRSEQWRSKLLKFSSGVYMITLNHAGNNLISKKIIIK